MILLEEAGETLQHTSIKTTAKVCIYKYYKYLRYSQSQFSRP
jgi:hypothetical protein